MFLGFSTVDVRFASTIVGLLTRSGAEAEPSYSNSKSNLTKFATL
jgi:hypothetical protein